MSRMDTPDEPQTATSRSDHPDIKVPYGHTILVGEDGAIEVVATGERLTKTIAFRVTVTEFVALMPFFESFPNGSMTTAMRWLLDQPAIKAEMAARVAASRIHA